MSSPRLFSAPSVGGLLALASLPLHVAITRWHSVELAAVTLAAVGAIYAGFGLQRGSVPQASGEVAVALVFIATALAGMWSVPLLIPAAFAAHGAWDMLHHADSRLVTVPRWYPPFCAVYDWTFAAGLTAVWLR